MRIFARAVTNGTASKRQFEEDRRRRSAGAARRKHVEDRSDGFAWAREGEWPIEGQRERNRERERESRCVVATGGERGLGQKRGSWRTKETRIILSTNIKIVAPWLSLPPACRVLPSLFFHLSVVTVSGEKSRSVASETRSSRRVTARAYREKWREAERASVEHRRDGTEAGEIEKEERRT